MTIQYTPLADRLLAYLAADRLNLSAKSSSLNTSILLSSDLFNQEGGIVTANYGFDGYMGILVDPPGCRNSIILTGRDYHLSSSSL